ncbi:photosystem II biogenesis protein Psp29 [Synechococcus sp. PCC 6312]|uniref:photosystem II biogenesis protein Psp29 n=1 Tax=Synechococcus sp. (strain ATCC 27167 / PCC 6312) TaxID=195253 RepID=UPI0003190447|nr:photosystem II biogenesis protein Psp29 [Synechococcus sp. PCC 6312]
MFQLFTVQITRTVSDTKKAFYAAHTRPIHSIFRRFVEELLVEVHLLRVNTNFVYSPLLALGIVTAYNHFMSGYRPETDRNSIFTSFAIAEEFDPQQLQADAARWEELAGLELEELQTRLQAWISEGGDPWHNSLRDAVNNPQTKYSRLQAIGLYHLLEQAAGNLTQELTTLEASLEQLSPVVNLPVDKVKKDLELYRSNLDKMIQAQKIMAELVEVERKRREQAANEANAPTPPASESLTNPESTSAEASS